MRISDNRCMAISRKTNKQCNHAARWGIPTTIAGHFICDKKWFYVSGREVFLCDGHATSFHARQKKLMSLKLIHHGYLSAYNKHGYGHVVTMCERCDFEKPIKVKLSPDWPACEWKGNIPQEIKHALGISHS